MAQNAVILEFKVCGKSETADDAAKRALKQINDRDYASKAREDGYKNIIKYGVAFKGKMCYAIVEWWWIKMVVQKTVYGNAWDYKNG